ncbi:hypothetical protein AAIB41_11545 [Brucella sp. BE17]|uniref:hypothetical protein n=1 Tax=Brucella sp. BE17 TaxID=3142977 RepID=UPI0031BA098B
MLTTRALISAAILLEARWTENMKTTAKISGHSDAYAGGYCAAVVTFAGAEGEQANPVLREMLDAFMEGQFNLLQIGMSAPNRRCHHGQL